MNGGGVLVVSVHDVAPPTRARVERMLDMLRDTGVTRRSLLVIPNFQGRHPIDRDNGFCAWLRACQAQGDEIVLHGWEHVGVGTPRNADERFRNRWFTQGEGEFLSLDYEQAFGRIARGCALMHRAGLDPQGFVAPAWLVTRDGVRAARDLGFQYTNSYLTVVDLAEGQRHLAPSVVFGPGHLNQDVGIALQERVSRLLTRFHVVRVVLHPPCIDHVPRMARVIGIIEQQLLRGRQAATYIEVIQQLRASRLSAALRRHAH